VEAAYWLDIVSNVITVIDSPPIVGIITKTEIPTSSHGDFNFKGYHTFLLVNHSEKFKTAKYRVIVVVRSELAALTKIRPDLMHPAVQSIWTQIDLGNRILVGGLYVSGNIVIPAFL
jgi:hypothetical protein